MNERDYLIIEAMVIAAGAMVVMTMFVMMLIFTIPIGLGLILAMSFVGFCTFFFGLYFHMKRRIFILEMQHLLKEADNEQTTQTIPK